MHKEGLARFEFDSLEFLFQKIGVKLVVHSTCSEELSEDLFAIINVFVASNNGRHAAQDRRRKPAERKKSQTTQEDEQEGKIVEENENSNYNKKHGLVKKE